MISSHDQARIQRLSDAARSGIEREEFGKAGSELARAIWDCHSQGQTFFKAEGMPGMQALMNEFDGPMLAHALRGLGRNDLAARIETPWLQEKFARAHPCWAPLRELDYPSFHDASIQSWRSGGDFLELVFDGYFDNERLAGAGDPSLKALLLMFHSPKVDMLYEGQPAQAPSQGQWSPGSVEPFAQGAQGPLLFDEFCHLHVDEVSQIGEPTRLVLGEGFGSAAEIRIGFSSVEIIWGVHGIGAWRSAKIAQEIDKEARAAKSSTKSACL